MKNSLMKTLKISLVSILSLLSVCLVAILIACYFVFSPVRLTPIVKKQLSTFVTCSSDIASVELTFFSTFPRFSLSIDSLSLDNNSPTPDSMLLVENLEADIQLMSLIFRNSIEIDKIRLLDSDIRLQVDSLGNANYDVFASDTTEQQTEESTEPFVLPFHNIDLSNISFENVSVTYSDFQSEMYVRLDSLFCSFDGTISDDFSSVETALSLSLLEFSMADSLYLKTKLNNPIVRADVELENQCLVGSLNGGVLLEYLAMANDTLASATYANLNLPFVFDMKDESIELRKAQFGIDSILLTLEGLLHYKENEPLVINMDLSTNDCNIDTIEALIPKSYKYLLSDFKDLGGFVSLSGRVVGLYSDSLMPTVNANIRLKNANVYHTSVPFHLKELDADVATFFDLNTNGAASTATINNLSASADDNTFSVSGNVHDLMNDITCDLDIESSLQISDLEPLLPQDVQTDFRGNINMHLNTWFKLSDISEGNIDRVRANGVVSYDDLYLTYDSMHVCSKSGRMSVKLPSKRKNKLPNELVELMLKAADLHVNMPDMVDAHISDPYITMAVSNPMDTTHTLSAYCEFASRYVQANQDSLTVSMVKPEFKASLYAETTSPDIPIVELDYASDKLGVGMQELLTVNTQQIRISATSAFDKTKQHLIDKWNPTLHVNLNQGDLDFASIEPQVLIPAIKLDITPEQVNIIDGRIIIGDSDFSLNGKINNITEYINDEALLKGELNYYSAQTNIDQLMELVDGLGGEEEPQSEVAENSSEEVLADEEAKPFMVPKGVDVVLNTRIENAIFSENSIENINGKLTVNDGKLVLEQMGFTSDAAEMLLTAVYRSDRENHLFAGFNFHLLDINIEQLIDLVPMVDSIVPMLSSFEGEAQFHCAGETYLNSKYEPKISTLRAAAAIEGKDLVVLDNETFDQMAKMLMFSKKSRNVIDSLSVEATVFKDEVDVFPFLISMDKWQAVLSGRHNLDNNFNYHVSLTDCPLPVRLGLDVKGNFDDMKYELVPCKYKSLYKPDKQGVTEKRVLDMKRIISESLKDNLKGKR